MDVDELPVGRTTDLLSLFDLTTELFPWRESRPEDIHARRAAMSNELFFDILLEMGGIRDVDTLYPPTDLASLRRLLDAIADATYDSMKRECLVYYLLKWHYDERELKYADEKCISPHYVALADAYWHLDTGVNLSRAIGLLSDARIVKEYTTKIMQTISLANDPTPLILKYVRTCKPALTEQEDLQRYFLALVEANLMEAWQYQRTFPPKSKTRDQLIQRLLDWTVTPKPRAQPLTLLLSLPFSSYEEAIIRDYAIHPPSHLPAPSIPVLRDLVCVRLIQSSRYVEAIKFDRQFPATSTQTKGTWSAERGRIVKEIMSALPAAERALLELEIDRQGPRPLEKRITASGSGSSWMNVSGNTELSMSWEDVGTKGPPTSNAKTVPRPSVGMASPAALLDRSISGAPRRGLASLRTQHGPLPNGGPASHTLFTPGASTSTTTRQPAPPLSAQSTLLLSQSSTSQAHSSSSQIKSGSSIFNLPASTQAASSPSTAQLTQSSATVNGTQKSNAFMARNAFFNPPPVPQPVLNGFHKSPEPETRQEVEDEPLLSRSDFNKSHESAAAGDAMSDGDSIVSGNRSRIEVDEGSAGSEKEDLGYSLFGPAATRTLRQRTPTKSSRSAKRSSEDRHPPGAFVPDPDDDVQPQAKPVTRQARPSVLDAPVSKKRTSRKRAASPEERRRQSIPGTLFEDDDEDEDHDRIAPLPRRPKRPTRKGKLSRASSTASSLEGEEDGHLPVRRSSRLSAASTSPIEAKTASRPRKSTRVTSASDATATGRGGAKKR